MHKKDQNHQYTLIDFNQPIGLKMNPENRYAKLFPSNTGKPAKSLRMAFGLNACQQEAPCTPQNKT